MNTPVYPGYINLDDFQPSRKVLVGQVHECSRCRATFVLPVPSINTDIDGHTVYCRCGTVIEYDRNGVVMRTLG